MKSRVGLFRVNKGQTDHEINKQGSISQTCLCAAFTCANTKSVERHSSHQCLFALLGSYGVKTARKTLVISTTWLE